MEQGKAQGTLLAHCGSREVGLRELRVIEPPPQLGPYHRPVQHGELVDSVRDCLAWYGVKIEREAFAVGGTRTIGEGTYVDVNLFGMFDVKVPDSGNGGGEWGFALGLRSNNVKQFAIRMVVGARVFVCDNMVLSGSSIALSRRHTSGLRLMEEVAEGVERYLEGAREYPKRIERMKERHLHDAEVKRVMWDAFSRNVLPTKLLRPIHEFYFEKGVEEPEAYPDCAGRTVWGMHNAVTRALKELPMGQRFKRTQKFEKYMEGCQAGYTMN